MLRKVISGAQTGADLAGLEVAQKFGLETGGTMPFGYKANDGCHPEFKEQFGIEFHRSSSYVPRTRKNVKDADATMRLAHNFDSPGEKCTLKAIENHGKPYFDVDLDDPPEISDVVAWLEAHNVEVLNIAGNSEETAPGTHAAVTKYLSELFEALGNSQCTTNTTPKPVATAAGHSTLSGQDAKSVADTSVTETNA